MDIHEWNERRPNGRHSALNHITVDKANWNSKWQQSKFHCDTDPGTRALIAGIHDLMGRLEKHLQKECKRDKDEDKRFALMASMNASLEDHRDLDPDYL